MSDLIAPLIVNKMTEKYADLFTPEASKRFGNFKNR